MANYAQSMHDNIPILYQDIYFFTHKQLVCTINHNSIHHSLSACLHWGYWLLSGVRTQTVDMTGDMLVRSMQAEPVEEDTLLLVKPRSGILTQYADLTESVLLVLASPLCTVALPARWY